MFLLLILSIVSPVFPILAGYKQYRGSLLWVYCLVALFFDLLIFTLRRIIHIGFLWPGNIFILLELFFLSYYLHQKIFRSFKTAHIPFILLSIFFVTSTLKKSVLVLNSSATSVFYLYYLALALAGFFSMIRNPKSSFIEKSSFFWANSSIFLYASGAFFILLFREAMSRSDNNTFTLLWGTLFLSLNILKNILLGIALLKKEDN